MKGSLVNRNGHYSVVLEDRDPVTGKRKQTWISVKGNFKEASRQMTELVNSYNTGEYIKPHKTTLADYLTQWLKDYVKVNLSPRGAERYDSICQKHLIPKLGNIPLISLKAEQIQKHYTDCINAGLSPRTVKYHHTVLHKALETARRLGLLSRNASDNVDIPRAHPREMQVWDVDEITKFLDAAKDTIYYALFHTALYTGMRRSELLALCWDDIDSILSQVSISKGLHQLKDRSYVVSSPKSVKSKRLIKLTPSSLIVLAEHNDKMQAQFKALGFKLKGDTPVFCHYDGSPLRPSTITRAWSLMAKKAGVKTIRFHDARHTHASVLLKQGVHPKIVQERLGHASIAITLDLYSHISPGMQEAAAKSFDDAFAKKYNENVVDKEKDNTNTIITTRR
jgi:integrase